MKTEVGAAAGRLHVVATPIGNLEDLSPRARRVLAEADLVACEDTRRTGRLLAALQLKKRLVSLHDHNERSRTPGLIETLLGGKSVALVSDAGTPLLSDPGFILVREAIRRGIPVESVPGPSAVMAALTVSGLPPYPFTFVGFLPAREGRRKKVLESLSALPHTLIVFASTRRLGATLEEALACLGDRPAVIARELTKLHEEVLRGSLSTLAEEVEARTPLKGEAVVVIGPAPSRRRLDQE